MIGKKYKVILTMGVVFLLMNVSLVSCTRNLLKASKTSSIDEKGNEEVLGKVSCIDGNRITLSIGNECELGIINEDSIDSAEEDENRNLEDNKLEFKLSGEEKSVEITNDNIINIEDETANGKLSDIKIGCILSVQYNESNNVVSVVIKNNNKYIN